MENYIKPALSEEQMAAYLDGMLSTEESEMVEELIYANPEMEEIQDSIDSIDSTFIYEADNEVPIECLADDFVLPHIGFDFAPADDIYGTEDYGMGEYEIADNSHGEFDELNSHDDYDDFESNDDFNDLDCQDDISEIGTDESFSDGDYGDFIF